MNDQEKARIIAEKVMGWTKQKLSGGMGWIDKHESAAEHPDIRPEDRELYDFPVFKAWVKNYDPANNIAQAWNAVEPARKLLAQRYGLNIENVHLNVTQYTIMGETWHFTNFVDVTKAPDFRYIQPEPCNATTLSAAVTGAILAALE